MSDESRSGGIEPAAPRGAVFLSYAREDTDAARRIADALRAFGVEVWFDQSELRGGDSWDAKIKKQIRECALFVPLVSQKTQERTEGYFRREWLLAVERTRDMAHGVAFIVPVAIDDTHEADAAVPEEFMRYQWTRLTHGVPSPQFVEQVKRLLEAPRKASSIGAQRTEDRGQRAAARGTLVSGRPAPKSPVLWTVGVLGAFALAVLTYFALRPNPAAPAAPAPSPVLRPPSSDSKSVAVLAFANLSDDRENEYFSDGISEELLTVLQKIPGLHVAARTSAFSFKGKNATAQEIGEKLGVANLVEGSVRRSGSTVRIAARLSRAATGEQLWSDSFTRDLKDVFAVQSEIAQTIVGQLRGQLGGATDAETKAAIQAQVQAAEKGGTRNVEAHQLYLQGKFFSNQLARDNLAQAAGFLRRAVELDPSFALAWAALSRVISYQGAYGTLETPLPDIFKESRAMAERALALEPDLAEAHAALYQVQAAYDLDWRGAAASARRALELAPSDATNLANSAGIAATFGQNDRAIELLRQALVLDPLNTSARYYLADAYECAGQFKEAEAESRRILELNPAAIGGNWGLCSVLLLEGRLDEAAEAAAREKEEWARLTALAIAHWAQKKPAESEDALKQLIERHNFEAAYQIAEVYAYRGEIDQAYAWLERAYRQHDSGLGFAKTDLFLKNIQADPRWPVFLHKLGLADDQLK